MKKIIGVFCLMLCLGILVGAQTAHNLVLTWNAVTQDSAGTPITGVNYNVYSGTAAGQTNTKLTPTPIAATSFVFTTGTPGIKYYFTVTSEKNSFESAKSNEVNATFLANPAAPSGVAAVAN